MDKKDVLKAIRNVKKYAKNLKKNATTMSQINLDEDSEIGSPHPFFSNSTTHLISNRIETSSSITYGNLSSFRQQRHINQLFNESSIPKMKRNLRSTLQPSDKLYDRVSHFSQKDKSLNIGLNKKQQSLQSSKYKGRQVQQVYRTSFVVQKNFIKELQSQIQFLQQQINLYKNAMLVIKRKYVQMEYRVSQKVAVDHYVDLLNNQLEIQREKNDRLTQVIIKQKQQIDAFYGKIATLSQKLSQIYYGQKRQLSKSLKVNSVLRKMLLLAQPSEKDIKTHFQYVDGNNHQEKVYNNEQCLLRQPSFDMANFEKKYGKEKEKDIGTNIYQFNF